jgi:hypothetical protein
MVLYFYPENQRLQRYKLGGIYAKINKKYQHGIPRDGRRTKNDKTPNGTNTYKKSAGIFVKNGD